VNVEGVQEKVDLKSDDARKLSFPDASFDVILSNLCIHNIRTPRDAPRPAAKLRAYLSPAYGADFRLHHTSSYEKRLLPLGSR